MMKCEYSDVSVCGYNWDNGINYDRILDSYTTSGFQATNVAFAINEMKKMIECRKQKLNEEEGDFYEEDEFIRRKKNLTIFLGYETRFAHGESAESIKFLIRNRMVDCLVTTPGSVELDILDCLRCHEQNEKRSTISDKKIFTQWARAVFDEMSLEQQEKNVIWTPSKMLTRIGLTINNPFSILTLAAQYKIPIFCPEITNGLLFAETFISNSNLVLDILGDLNRINSMALKAKHSSIISLGAGVVKHHMCKANCVRDGADFAIYINEALEFDGSDSGALPDESVACGKIKTTANPVKIFGNANMLFPLIVTKSFAKYLPESRS